MTRTSSHAPRTRTNRTARVTAGLVAGAALVLAAPLAASAHVHVTPDASEAGTSTRLAFSFSHGCDDSPTTALTITVPEGVDGATPVLDGAWTISRELGDDGIPTSVTYTAVTPVETGVAASVALDVIFASSAAENSVAFPVLQSCVTGETDWSEVADEGQSEDDLESPAPVVAVGAVAEGGDEHGHGDASASADADADAHDDHADAADGDAASSGSSASDATAVWLSGGALVVALAALGVAIFGRRKA